MLSSIFSRIIFVLYSWAWGTMVVFSIYRAHSIRISHVNGNDATILQEIWIHAEEAIPAILVLSAAILFSTIKSTKVHLLMVGVSISLIGTLIAFATNLVITRFVDLCMLNTSISLLCGITVAWIMAIIFLRYFQILIVRRNDNVRSPCPRCGYDLFGSEECCPECNWQIPLSLRKHQE